MMVINDTAAPRIKAGVLLTHAEEAPDLFLSMVGIST